MSVQTAAGTEADPAQAAAATVSAALRGGLLGTVVAAVAWVIAGALTGSAFVLLVVASIAVAVWVALRGSVGELGLAVARRRLGRGADRARGRAGQRRRLVAMRRAGSA